MSQKPPNPRLPKAAVDLLTAPNERNISAKLVRLLQTMAHQGNPIVRSTRVSTEIDNYRISAAPKARPASRFTEMPARFRNQFSDGPAEVMSDLEEFWGCRHGLREDSQYSAAQVKTRGPISLSALQRGRPQSYNGFVRADPGGLGK